MNTYIWMLRITSILFIIVFGMLVVVSDSGEEQETWEFVPVTTK